MADHETEVVVEEELEDEGSHKLSGTFSDVESHDDDRVSEVPPPKVQDLSDLEYTVAIVKPHAFPYVNTIERAVLEKGFTIIKKKIIKLTPEQAAQFFMKREKPDPIKVPRLICYMVSGPSQVMILARKQAVRYWLHAMGPPDPCVAKPLYPLSLRAKYGENELKNALYGSRNQDEAAKDIGFFFRDVIVEPSSYRNRDVDSDPCSKFLSDKLYLKKYVYPTLQQGLTELVRRKPPQPYQWLVDWLIENDPYPPKMQPNELNIIPN